MAQPDNCTEKAVGAKGISQEKYSTDNCNVYDTTQFCNLLKNILDSEQQEKFLTKKSIAEISALPARQYLEETVIPILLQALHFLVKERPPEPINALCAYLLKYRDKFEIFWSNEEPEVKESVQGLSKSTED